MGHSSDEHSDDGDLEQARPLQKILFFVKFLSSDERVESLLRGKLYAQRLSCFKQSDDGTASGRLDRHEGTSSWMQPGSYRLEINGWDMTPDLAGPTPDAAELVQPSERVLRSCRPCRRHGSGPGRGRRRGRPAAATLGPGTLLRIGRARSRCHRPSRVQAPVPRSANDTRYRAWSHLVRYYDPSSFHGRFEGIDPVFRKRTDYSYQREYRFAIDTGTTGDDPLHLDIGDIRDKRCVSGPKNSTANSSSAERYKSNRTPPKVDAGREPTKGSGGGHRRSPTVRRLCSVTFRSEALPPRSPPTNSAPARYSIDDGGEPEYRVNSTGWRTPVPRRGKADGRPDEAQLRAAPLL